MANWKKMVEAFGRALAQNKGFIKEDLNKAERSVLEAGCNHGDDAIGSEFRRGAREGTADRIEAEARAITAQDKGTRGSIDQLADNELDRINDARTDRALADEFDKGFNEAIQRHGEDALWNAISELRAKGISDGDILDYLKGK